tara:strand:+ start:1028 stop:1708 length:681 start_codon:yes stop_codon:yes gene_type:complete
MNILSIVIAVIIALTVIIFLFKTFEKKEQEQDHIVIHHVLRNNREWKKLHPDVDIYSADNFLSDEMCNKIINDAKGSLEDSPLTRKLYNFRTSKTSYNIDDEVDKLIEKYFKCENIASEKTQVQMYSINNEFKDHFDWFDEIDKDFIGHRGQRTWTIMVYLNDVDSGGETNFPKLGLNIIPKKGKAVVWNNLHEDGNGNYEVIHSGKPVTKGEKWIITKWIRSNKK